MTDPDIRSIGLLVETQGSCYILKPIIKLVLLDTSTLQKVDKLFRII